MAILGQKTLAHQFYRTIRRSHYLVHVLLVSQHYSIKRISWYYRTTIKLTYRRVIFIEFLVVPFAEPCSVVSFAFKFVVFNLTASIFLLLRSVSSGFVSFGGLRSKFSESECVISLCVSF